MSSLPQQRNQQPKTQKELLDRLDAQKKINEDLSELFKLQQEEIKKQNSEWQFLLQKVETEYENKLSEYKVLLSERLSDQQEMKTLEKEGIASEEINQIRHVLGKQFSELEILEKKLVQNQQQQEISMQELRKELQDKEYQVRDLIEKDDFLQQQIREKEGLAKEIKTRIELLQNQKDQIEQTTDEYKKKLDQAKVILKTRLQTLGIDSSILFEQNQ